MPASSNAYATERAKWRDFPRTRPADIVVPGPGQVSVWDFPRPPRVEPVTKRVLIEFAGRIFAETHRAIRICETSSPPVYYIPPADVALELLEPSERTSFCEWKGVAHYWTVRAANRVAKDAAWSYPEPDLGYESIRGYLAFYPRRMEACYVGEHRVEPQPGFYYGGWITPELVGPFKGLPGSGSW